MTELWYQEGMKPQFKSFDLRLCRAVYENFFFLKLSWKANSPKKLKLKSRKGIRIHPEKSLLNEREGYGSIYGNFGRILKVTRYAV